jgi:hypothetical protein
MLAVVTVVDDGKDAHRAPKGVSSAVFKSMFESLRKNKIIIK